MSLQRFSSRDIPEPDRTAFFRDVYTVVEQIDIEPLNDEPLVIDSAVRMLDDIAIVEGSCSPCVSRRTAAHLADGKDNLVLAFVTSGAIARSRNGAEPTLLGAGDAYLGTNGVPSEHRFGVASSFLDIAIPRARLEPLLSDAGRAVALEKLPPRPELILLARYATALIGGDLEALSPQAASHCAGHLVDLAAMAAGATRDAGIRASRRGVRQARLAAIKADIEANLGRPDLSLDWLAGRHGISPRYIRDLFLGTGTSFTEFVLTARLERAHERLRAAPPAHGGISVIAFETGFGDLSYFNRAFRRRFGMTPSDVRRATGM
ncbi:helix-turn-helix transcriptional regulator [Paracoccus sp. P2]|uniref:helix-turn-helix transcriptional regulator n=1 Tax=Paracoccus sp. P2 TaxID=3248840 RepID=UPI00391F0B6B